MVLTRHFLGALLSLASLGAQSLPYGLPACNASDEELADRTYFVLCHSASRKVPTWVGYQLRPEHLTPVAHRPTRFRRDTALLHEGARDSDYLRSGYSRGHMAPAADFASTDDSIRATFLLSNAAPQVQSLNAGLWSRLEQAVRRLASQADAVYIITGPIFEGDPRFIGAGHVAVPSHFFKAILLERGGQHLMYAAILPNTAVSASQQPLSRFLTTVQEVERRTGLDFFAALDDTEEHLLESTLLLLPE